jgi:RNA polymerase sigma-70 factor (ECF subfamily)
MADRTAAAEHDDQSPLLASTGSGTRRDARTFDELVASHRRELQLHCYRMLGSLHDAEDLVQETLLRAWRAFDTFDGRGSVRGWLYRIATNACLNALASSAARRRVLPESEGPPSAAMPPREPALDVAWLEPYPDAAIDFAVDAAPGPDARYERREAVHLAFVAAIQHLPPRQRAALLLCDVLDWSAAETARVLETSVPAVNSALQRARATLETHRPAWRQNVRGVAPDERQRALLDRYVRSWETADVDAFVSVLREDAVLSMPPWREWYRGRDALRTFFAFTARPGGHAPFRLVPTAANGQMAFAFYSRWRSADWQAHSIQVLELDGDRVRTMTSFVTPALFSAFGLADVLR